MIQLLHNHGEFGYIEHSRESSIGWLFHTIYFSFWIGIIVEIKTRNIDDFYLEKKKKKTLSTLNNYSLNCWCIDHKSEVRPALKVETKEVFGYDLNKKMWFWDLNDKMWFWNHGSILFLGYGWLFILTQM